jgi:hypothetical protein
LQHKKQEPKSVKHGWSARRLEKKEVKKPQMEELPNILVEDKRF